MRYSFYRKGFKLTTLAKAIEVPQEAAVVTKAFIRAGQQLGLSNKQLAAIIDVSESHLSRMSSQTVALDKAKTNQWGASLLFIRLYRGLISAVGDQSTAKLWLHSFNTALNGIPIDLITSYEGLIDVARYVDFQRGQF